MVDAKPCERKNEYVNYETIWQRIKCKLRIKNKPYALVHIEYEISIYHISKETNVQIKLKLRNDFLRGWKKIN